MYNVEVLIGIGIVCVLVVVYLLTRAMATRKLRAIKARAKAVQKKIDKHKQVDEPFDVWGSNPQISKHFNKEGNNGT